MGHRQGGACPPPQSPRQTPESAASSLVRRALGLCQTLRFGPMTRRRLFDAAGVPDILPTHSEPA